MRNYNRATPRELFQSEALLRCETEPCLNLPTETLDPRPVGTIRPGGLLYTRLTRRQDLCRVASISKALFRSDHKPCRLALGHRAGRRVSFRGRPGRRRGRVGGASGDSSPRRIKSPLLGTMRDRIPGSSTNTARNRGFLRLAVEELHPLERAYSAQLTSASESKGLAWEISADIRNPRAVMAVIGSLQYAVQLRKSHTTYYLLVKCAGLFTNKKAPTLTDDAG
jgi:hypothetical protein